ncbi:MAG: MotA/TolQ/ExbB proton channel family protein [Prevotella sp.]|nr:MotA/TolQ/ExbB proton channel family protein [Prevotella sp.]
MKRASVTFLFLTVFLLGAFVSSTVQKTIAPNDTTATIETTDSIDTALDLATDSLSETALTADDGDTTGLHKVLKEKFIEGNAGFMSLVALALIIGLTFCIERIIYLSLSEINNRDFMNNLCGKIGEGDINGAKTLCHETRGPVAAICQQGLLRIDDTIVDIERAISSYGSVQADNLEKGCSWIKLFIVMAPSLGFLGTVIGMVMAFDQIQNAGDISPTIVASGMKVALITTIFGIIVALILQLFYNYVLTKVDRLTTEMEEASTILLDAVSKYKRGKEK